MEITLIDEPTYNLLKSIQENYPNLTYQNTGYDYPNKSKWSDEDKRQFNIVTDILKKTIKDFVEFNHFKINKNDNDAVVLRFQYKWSNSFIGVGYVKLDELLNGFDKTEFIMAKESKSLTESDIKNTIKETFEKNYKKNEERGVVIFQFCLTANDAVPRSSLNMNICGNPDCKNCRELNDLIKEEVSKFDLDGSE